MNNESIAKLITFIITINKRTYYSNDVDTAADIIYKETGDERDYERLKYILGNMKFNELFHGKNTAIYFRRKYEYKN